MMREDNKSDVSLAGTLSGSGQSGVETVLAPESPSRIVDIDAADEAALFGKLDSIPTAILVADSNGRIVHLNHDCADLFGYESGDAIGKPIEALVPVEHQTAHVDHRKSYTAAPVRRLMGQDRIVKGVRKDGTEVHLEIGLGMMTTSAGARVVATIQDISKRRYYEEKLRNANSALASKNADLDEFVYMASHDLQEPIRKLISFSELLPTDLDCELSDAAARDLKFIVESAYRMRRLVLDLLALSRAGKGDLRRKSVDLGRCVSDAMSALDSVIRESGATIRVPDMPVVKADPFLMTQLFQNLIGNAMKFVPKNTRPIVEVTSEKCGNEHVFGVRDNGIGIAPRYHDRVFGAFRRLHTRSEYDGTGVGLSICRKAVERHGGRIWVESELGAGAHFRFTIGDA